MGITKRDKLGRFVEGRQKGNPILYICEHCGLFRFADMPCKVKRFCSFSCSNQWKWDNLRVKERKVVYYCNQCKKECYKIKTYKYKEGAFCSKECFYKSRKQNPPNWLNPFPKGHKSWNQGKSMDLEFRIFCKHRAENQWKDLNFREKQMKRTDRLKFNKAGIKALRIYWQNPINKWKRTQAGKTLHDKFLEKVGILQ